MGIRAHPRLTSGKTSKGHFGTQSVGCAGQTVRPSFHSISQTSAGKLSILKLVSLCFPSLMSDGDNPRLTGATARENRPGDAGELVGEGDRQHVAVQPPGCLLDPRPQTPHRCIRPPRQHDVCGLHEQCPQILVAALGDLAQDRAISGRLLLRYEPQPGRRQSYRLETVVGWRAVLPLARVTTSAEA